VNIIKSTHQATISTQS